MNERQPVLALQMKSVTKQFPGTIAVNQVDFDVFAGDHQRIMAFAEK